MFLSKIVTDIVSHVRTCLGCTEGFGLCEQLEDGKITLMINEGKRERQYVGLLDNIHNYFYIRTLDSFINEKPVPKKTSGGSCIQQHEILAKLRLVASWKCADPESLLNRVKACLIDAGNTTKSKSGEYRNIKSLKIEFIKSTTNFEAIFKEETKKKDVVWNTSEKLTMLDFTLRYRYDYCNVTVEDLQIC